MADARMYEPAIPVASPTLGREALDGVAAVRQSGRGSDAVAAFGPEFDDDYSLAHGVVPAAGTTALHAALATPGIAPGDRVVTPPVSFSATADGEPPSADVDPKTHGSGPVGHRRGVRAGSRRYPVGSVEDADCFSVAPTNGMPTG